ncbi:uncharacterized protein LOC114755747 [Neltuma alba]|uniref:uncharacterized protein LOC114755747 n=1 Tax=Neltuma alba TaxID=207710 RepID=UPI0010A59602|nr:uncharacterized protein LOC114755747 [Prosopis alba]
MEGKESLMSLDLIWNIILKKQDDLRWVPPGEYDCLLKSLVLSFVINRVLWLDVGALRLNDVWTSSCMLLVLEVHFEFQCIPPSLVSREWIKAVIEDTALASKKLGSFVGQVSRLPPFIAVFLFIEALEVGLHYSAAECSILLSFRILILCFVVDTFWP